MNVFFRPSSITSIFRYIAIPKTQEARVNNTMRFRVFYDARKRALRFRKAEVTHIRALPDAHGLPTGFYTFKIDHTGISVVEAPSSVHPSSLMSIYHLISSDLQPTPPRSSQTTFQKASRSIEHDLVGRATGSATPSMSTGSLPSQASVRVSHSRRRRWAIAIWQALGSDLHLNTGILITEDTFVIGSQKQLSYHKQTSFLLKYIERDSLKSSPGENLFSLAN